MKWTRTLVLGLCAWMWAGTALGSQGSQSAQVGPARVKANVVLKVSNKAMAQKSVVAEAEKHGGYFSYLDDGVVTLRVPVAHADAFLDFVAQLGVVAGRDYASEDLRELLDQKTTRLNARKKVLDQYFKLLGTADSKAVLTVEREITRLVAEVERYEGAIRLLRHDARLASVTVRFQFRDRTQPNQQQGSSFDWLNTLSLADLVDEGAEVSDVGGLKNKVDAQAPDGFAAYGTKRRFWAASPDGVLYRVRTETHKPQADLPFWAESMAKHLSAAGYRLHSKSDVKAGQTAGHMIETYAPLGPHDYAYNVVIFPVGKRLVIVEVAGPAEKVGERRDAVAAAINRLEF